MNTKTPLYKYLLSTGKSTFKLRDLKTLYTPIEVASQIKPLMEQELIEVDWETKTIQLDNLSIKTAFKNKNEIGQFEREIPEYMKEEKVEINKPFLTNKLKK